MKHLTKNDTLCCTLLYSCRLVRFRVCEYQLFKITPHVVMNKTVPKNTQMFHVLENLHIALVDFGEQI